MVAVPRTISSRPGAPRANHSSGQPTGIRGHCCRVIAHHPQPTVRPSGRLDRGRPRRQGRLRLRPRRPSHRCVRGGGGRAARSRPDRLRGHRPPRLPARRHRRGCQGVAPRGLRRPWTPSPAGVPGRPMEPRGCGVGVVRPRHPLRPRGVAERARRSAGPRGQRRRRRHAPPRLSQRTRAAHAHRPLRHRRHVLPAPCEVRRRVRLLERAGGARPHPRASSRGYSNRSGTAFTCTASASSRPASLPTPRSGSRCSPSATACSR